LLNIGYFHIVFTIPDTLNPIAFQNQKVVYNILFKAAAETLTELAADTKYLGAQIGFTSILHTWGQNLTHHPHIHCIVPGGGITPDGRWVNSRGCGHDGKSQKPFFIPVWILSRKFRGKFLFYLKQAHRSGDLEFHGLQSTFVNKDRFHEFLSGLYAKDWVVYCKPPFKTAASVVEYLGRYTHRIAISNNRIISADNGVVRFKWRDYKDGSRWKVMELAAGEFIRRFLIHVLPPRFIKIRHYGLLGNRNRKEKLILCKELTNTPISADTSDSIAKISTVELILKITGIDITKCPVCGSGNISKRELQSREPPQALTA